MKYFDDNWDPIKDEWDRSIKSTLEELLANFFIELHMERTERDHKAINVVHKIPIIPSNMLPIKKYSDLLTQYSFNHVEKE
ncbi:protein FAR1-RELATED SEQUENCE 5-like [Aphis craccivora]|uniref:Protein FAR1-RELATED SEQUENCE 5-like n=1 Tax=Aphis craccivora TaxID=307492 RepID=A0A6G0W1H7_APHCR|nr:protein FAR1-RELATED SEQUENCE 5-like [Aphis craccivora]KAF0719063.1 protein FAR1-RELATED SEQUENCE 5-like [Aphis craccivora]